MRIILSFVCLLIAGTAAQAGPGREALDRFMGELTTLEARFEQSVLDTEHSRQGLFYGTFQLQRPDRFRWDYLVPERKQIIADGRDLWVVDIELNQITQHYQSLALKNTPASVLLSSEPLEKTFEVVELGEKLEMQWIELLPRDQESDVVRILLAFKGDDLLRLELIDAFGQISRFSFFEIKRNPEIPAEQFDYQPPEEWDVFSDYRG
jgi:outer membrane lipoprotein carrier protein